MGADHRVMHYFERTQTRDEVEAMVARMRAHLAEHGFGFLAAEIPGEAAFAGVIGLAHLRYEAHFTPAVEIGWRLAPGYWGRGLATEGARALLADAFVRCGLEHVVAVAVEQNRASLAVMERLGMTRDPAGDFDHPMVPEGHPYRRHLLYRIAARHFDSTHSTG